MASMVIFTFMKEKWFKLRANKWFQWSTNKFTLTTIGFIIWMLFLDVNSYLIHHELNTEIDELEESINYYQSEIKTDRKQLEELTSNPEKLEKFAREQYWMKRQGEEIYLIEE